MPPKQLICLCFIGMYVVVYTQFVVHTTKGSRAAMRTQALLLPTHTGARFCFSKQTGHPFIWSIIKRERRDFKPDQRHSEQSPHRRSVQYQLEGNESPLYKALMSYPKYTAAHPSKLCSDSKGLGGLLPGYGIQMLLWDLPILGEDGAELISCRP